MMSAASSQLEKLERICAKNPTSILFARLAEGFLQQGDVRRAAEICRQGFRYRPSYVAGHMVMGKCHLKMGHLEEARQEFQKVLQLDADHPAALWHLGQIDLQLGWEDLALRHFKLALVLDPLNGKLVAQIAQLKAPDQSLDDDIAIEDAVEHEEADKPSVDETPFDETVPDDVSEDIEPDVKVAPDENLSLLVAELGHAEQADVSLPCEQEPIATATLAELYAGQGLIEQAVRILERVLLRDPDNQQVQTRLEELRGS